MIRRHADVGGALLNPGSALDQRQNRTKNAAHGADLLAFVIGAGGHSKKMAEELVCPINQVNIHVA